MFINWLIVFLSYLYVINGKLRIINFSKINLEENPKNFIKVDEHRLICPPPSSWEIIYGKLRTMDNNTIVIDSDTFEQKYATKCFGIAYNFNVINFENFNFYMNPSVPQSIKRNSDVLISIIIEPRQLKRDPTYFVTVNQVSGPSKLKLHANMETLRITVPKETIEGSYSIIVRTNYDIFNVYSFKVEGIHTSIRMQNKGWPTEIETTNSNYNLQKFLLIYMLCITIALIYLLISFMISSISKFRRRNFNCIIKN